jgi:hypothetical protein
LVVEKLFELALEVILQSVQLLFALMEIALKLVGLASQFELDFEGIFAKLDIVIGLRFSHPKFLLLALVA